MAFRQCMQDTYETQMNSVFGFVSLIYNVSYINISKPTKPETLNTSGPKPFQIKNAGLVLYLHMLCLETGPAALLGSRGHLEASTPEAFARLQIFQGEVKVLPTPLLGTTVGPHYFPEDDKCSHTTLFIHDYGMSAN